MSETIRTIEDFSMEAIAESGQCFRIVRKETAVWTVTAFGRYLEVSETKDGRWRFSCSDEEFDSFWRAYFDLDTDYGIYKAAALPDDEYLKTAIAFGSGIRMLRQEPWEMLISFIISQRKSVPAIRTSIERLSERFGKRIYTGTDANALTAVGNEGHAAESSEHPAEKSTVYNEGSAGAERTVADIFYAFPGPEALAAADSSELAACGLGYRLEYIRNAAVMVLSGELDLEALGELDTAELIAELMKLKGVGIKVASCIALFGYHRLDTVPVDVWMKRVIEQIYHGELPEAYRQYAGVLQQYMFNYARLSRLK